MSELRPEIVTLVQKCIADSLALTPDEVPLHASLIDELGADSLDFADIIFAIGQDLDIQVRDSEFNFITRLDFSSPAVMKDGILAADVVERLAAWLPALAALPDKTRVTPRQLFSAITVEAICLVASRHVTSLGR